MMTIKTSYIELFLCNRPYAKVCISFLSFVTHINIISFIVVAQDLVLLFFILIGLLNAHWTHCFLKLKLYFLASFMTSDKILNNMKKAVLYKSFSYNVCLEPLPLSLPLSVSEYIYDGLV